MNESNLESKLVSCGKIQERVFCCVESFILKLTSCLYCVCVAAGKHSVKVE